LEEYHRGRGLISLARSQPFPKKKTTKCIQGRYGEGGDLEKINPGRLRGRDEEAVLPAKEEKGAGNLKFVLTGKVMGNAKKDLVRGREASFWGE